MKAVEVKDKKAQKKFLDFRKKIYRDNPVFVDNNLFMLKEFFAGKTSFTENKELFVYNIEDKDVVLCQGIIIYTKMLPEYVQLCFFESLPNVNEAVKDTPGVTDVALKLVFEPEWDKSRMSEEAMLELGLL